MMVTNDKKPSPINSGEPQLEVKWLFKIQKNEPGMNVRTEAAEEQKS